jgi:hypothetical protein
MHTPAGMSASAASGMTIDARLTSLDEALVNLWVRCSSNCSPSLYAHT